MTAGHDCDICHEHIKGTPVVLTLATDDGQRYLEHYHFACWQAATDEKGSPA